MKPIRTSESDPFTDEDRARLRLLIGEVEARNEAEIIGPEAESIARALAHIDHLERMVTRVHELTMRLDSWESNHGPMDDPVPGKLVVAMLNAIGDPRDLKGEDESYHDRRVQRRLEKTQNTEPSTNAL